VLFDTLQIPEPLLIAQQEGRLVVFAGAGVSIGRPSNLPSFLELTELIARRRLTPREKMNLDHFMGELKDAGMDVHADAARILRRDSAPTQLHSDLARLFPTPESLRIVTTNFDPHFRTVLRAWTSGIPIFTAPALPRGGNFSGLVELHGSALGITTDMVLTDRDFGLAYMTEGWARNFVEQMFRNYVVLFVGYSLTDPPMHYLARGLPTEKESRRFVITNQDPSRWKALGVGVISYRAKSGQRRHAPLNRGVASWVQITRGSYFGLEQRIIEILERPDPSALSAADADLLVWSLGQDHTAIYFSRNARGIVWVEWLSNRGLLRPYFEPKTVFEHARQRQIAIWLADRLIAGPKERAIGIVHAHGGRFSSELYRWLIFGMDKNGAPIEWTLLLVSQADAHDVEAHFNLGMRASALAHADSPAFWPIWSELITPKVELNSNGLESTRDAHAEVGLKGMAGDIWITWREGLRPHLATMAKRLLSLLLEKWFQACDLARALDGEEALCRRATDTRRRILAGPYDHQHREHRLDVLVDMLADLVGYLAQQASELSRDQITEWLNSSNSVVRRLGLHALSLSTGISAPEKADWVRQRVDSYPDRSPERREAQDLLAELSAPTLLGAQAPQITDESTSPTLPTFLETLPSIESMLAMSAEELRQRLQFVRWSQTIVFAALRDLDAATTIDPRLVTNSLWLRLLQSSVWRELNATERDELLAIVHRHGLLSRYPAAVIRALFHADPLEAEGAVAASETQIEVLFSSTLELWRVLAPADEIEDEPDYVEVDWVAASLSHGVYHLVQFWFRYLSLQPVSPLTMPPRLAAVFEDVSTRNTSTGRRARAVLVQDMGYLMVRDSAWTRHNIVPLFDFAGRGNEAWVAWRSFLDHGRMNRPLAVLLIPVYRSSRERILGTRTKLIEEYLSNVAGMMVYVHTDESLGWQEELLPMLPIDERLRWARLIGRELPALTEEQQSALWGNWLNDYWSQRRHGHLGSHSMPLTPREAAIMAGWLPSLPAVFPQAFALVGAGTAFAFGEERIDWRELRQSAVPTRHPAGFIAFIEFLLAHAPPATVHPDSIKDALASLPRVAALRSGLTRIAESFQSYGWIGAQAFRAWIEKEFSDQT
jgi:hypothetical protein